METLERKVLYYHLSQKQIVNDNEVPVAKQEILKNFDYIYKSMTDIGNNRRAKFLRLDNSEVVVEVINYQPSNHFAFLRIGHQNHSTTTALRDQESLKTQAITMTETQRVEIYTCCYIDFSTCVVSYIGLVTAPRISALRALFNECLMERNITSTLSSILCPTVLDKILNGRISSIDVTVAVPNDDVLSNAINVNRAIFAKLQDIQHFEYTWSLRSKRLKSMCKSPGTFSVLIEDIKNLYDNHPSGHTLMKFKLKSKPEGESSQVVDLLQENMTYRAVITVNVTDPFDGDAVLKALMEALKERYEIDKTGINEYIRNI